MSIFFQVLAASSQNTPSAYDYNKDVVMVFDGNSLTLGTYASDNTIEQYYPKQVSAYFDGKVLSKEFYSYGVNGQTTQQMIADAPTQIYTKAVAGKENILVGWEDANSIDGGRTGQQNFDDFVTYFQGAKDAGFQHCVIVLGYYPRGGNFAPSFATEQDIFHNLVETTPLSEVPWDRIVYLMDAPHIGGERGQSQNEYFGDYIHLNTIGYDIVANEVTTKINQLLGI